MLVKFTTRSYPDIVMFGDVAKKLLKLAGHTGTVPSAINAEDVGIYREKLILALEDLKQAELPDFEQTDDHDEPVISLKQRAQPLIELFDAAIENEDVVTWEQG